jgi:hypothetical protein
MKKNLRQWLSWLAFSEFISSICFWIVLNIRFSNSLPVVDKSLIGREFRESLGSLPGFGRVMIFASFHGARNWLGRKQWLSTCVKCTRGLTGRCRRHSFGVPSKPQAFRNFRYCISFETSQGRNLTGVPSSTLASRAWTVASTCCLWSQPHKLCAVNWFSEQYAIALTLSMGSNKGPKEPWNADGAFGPPLLVRYFATGHIAWGVSSQLANFVSHLSSALFLSESEFLYDWRFTINQLVSAPSILRLTTSLVFFSLQLNPYGHSPCVTSSLTRRWACLLLPSPDRIENTASISYCVSTLSRKRVYRAVP